MAVPFELVCPVTQKSCDRACSGPCDRIRIENQILEEVSSPVPPVGIEGSIELVLHGFIGARLLRVEEDRVESTVSFHFDNGAYISFVFEPEVLRLLGGGFTVGETS